CKMQLSISQKLHARNAAYPPANIVGIFYFKCIVFDAEPHCFGHRRRAAEGLFISEEALLLVPANRYPERPVPVPYRDEAEFLAGMRAAAFGIHANNLVPLSAAKN